MRASIQTMRRGIREGDEAWFSCFCFPVGNHEFLVFQMDVCPFHSSDFPGADAAEGAYREPGDVVGMVGVEDVQESRGSRLLLFDYGVDSLFFLSIV